MSLCKYKNLFGEPRTGGHSYRIFDIAIVDVLSTVLVSLLFHQIIIIKLLNMRKHCIISFIIVLTTAFILGVILHRVFCVRTTVDKWLFKD